MALRFYPSGCFLPAVSPSCKKMSSSSSSSNSTSSIPMTCTTTTTTTTSVRALRTSSPSTSSPDLFSKSPMRTAEELASLLGLEMAVAGLERLFRESDPPVSPGHHGRPVRVAYQGVRGSYCQEAATMAFPPSFLASEAFPCVNMEDAFSALEDRTADRAVVPAENSLDGPIDRNLDLLLRHPAVRIVGELILPVNHCLLSLPGVQRSGLRRVVSHPQALSHCAEGLRALGVEVEEVSNAAEAAQFVAENRIADTAVIGSEIAASEFGLQVLERNFQDRRAGNYNRFLQLGMGLGSKTCSPPPRSSGGAHKTTVAFSLERGVSDLFQAMWAFESRGVRVTRVQHRPNRSNPVRLVQRDGVVGATRYFDYVFIVDVEGSDSHVGVQAAINQLRAIAGFVRVLGSYVSACVGTSS
ncbi:arogenate dehydratase 3, chloroplastic-like [Dioscorea cayenensis subsp. rotundata]|uniref:Arogenate dehydratase 3, chloroplastic-like n=1 Tax=Dioscorea cayennensis subsp. rotundata TaxID=55577 RepID=A0AB40ATV6_DIOCR|nr:arogenate dehydratase 3, chloroplastic-like [Dioscorea cayenensis subsp. rotundata]